MIKGETFRARLACIIEGKCLKCNAAFTIPSSSQITTSTGKKFWKVNLGAVLGQMATGGGASWLQQVMGSVGVASLSKQTFTSTERFITEEVERQLSQTMLVPAKRNRKMLKIVETIFKECRLSQLLLMEGGRKALTQL